MDLGLGGRTAIVCGGSAGIGLGCAEALREAGANVVLFARGREGLEPEAAWFEVAKLQALAARQVSRELGTAYVFSWGWGVFNEAGSDPDKQGAACVWLWARDPLLCNAPRHVADFDPDRHEGQIDLVAGARCALGTD